MSTVAQCAGSAQFENLPEPLSSTQARELLVRLEPPYDLMARWQLYTGLRVSELLRLTVQTSYSTRRRDAVPRGTASRGSLDSQQESVAT